MLIDKAGANKIARENGNDLGIFDLRSCKALTE